MEEQGNKGRVIGRLGEEHQRLRQLLSSLPPDQWTAAGASGEWSVKDLLAFVIAREQDTLQGLELSLRGIPQAQAYKDLDSFNRRVVEDNRSRPFEELLEVWDESFRKLFSAVSQLKEEDFSPDSPVSRNLGGSTGKILENNTYGFYEKNRKQIEGWLGKHAPGR